ncbi:acyl carrier protein [Gluconacetobacter azotocaptans]|uniref:acyl carrier protein n=1 Tax=Gluconacetobacter azotocaptans TaxID=142834 RepID=UPI00195AABD1|nr:acyl carrier protein [Gluconacetobacter azotocaptans]MBM9400369.1 acyl carrier protein [Gluconacetobacter azotocaptans]
MREAAVSSRIAKRVRRIVAVQVGCERRAISLTDRIDELGLGNIDRLEIVLDCQRRFGVRVDGEFAWVTVADIIAAVRHGLDYQELEAA